MGAFLLILFYKFTDDTLSEYKTDDILECNSLTDLGYQDWKVVLQDGTFIIKSIVK